MAPLGRYIVFFFFKQKTAYEITYGDWSSDVCSSDVPQKNVKAGDDPSDAHGEQTDYADIDWQQEDEDADLGEHHSGGGHHQGDAQQMTDEGRKKYRNGNDLGRKNSLGDEVRLFEQARSRSLHGVAEQEPGEHARKEKERVVGSVSASRHLLPQTEGKNERPTQQQHEGMDQAPDPADSGSDESLFEIPANQLEEQTAPFHQIMQKKRAGDALGHRELV